VTAEQATLFDVPAPATQPRPPKLTPAAAAGLYRGGMSACEIAQAYKLTRGGVEARIRAGGLGGNQWCPIHRTHETLRLEDPGVPPNAGGMWGAVDAPEWRQPAGDDASRAGAAACGHTELVNGCECGERAKAAWAETRRRLAESSPSRASLIEGPG